MTDYCPACGRNYLTDNRQGDAQVQAAVEQMEVYTRHVCDELSQLVPNGVCQNCGGSPLSHRAKTVLAALAQARQEIADAHATLDANNVPRRDGLGEFRLAGRVQEYINNTAAALEQEQAEIARTTEKDAIIAAVINALSGAPVDDFMASFHPVRLALDVFAGLEQAKEAASRHWRRAEYAESALAEAVSNCAQREGD